MHRRCEICWKAHIHIPAGKRECESASKDFYSLHMVLMTGDDRHVVNVLGRIVVAEHFGRHRHQHCAHSRLSFTCSVREIQQILVE